MLGVVSLLACVGGTHAGVGPRFADRAEAAWYAPAPGQFVNDPAFNDPARALGPPIGSTLAQADNTSVVSLGGFGGSLILGFSDTVLDDPCNPMGLDAIVYGNAFYLNADPTRCWGEAGVIEISVDENQNGQPDDTWFVVRFPTLPSVPSGSLANAQWDNDAGTGIPPLNSAWYPASAPAPTYNTEGYLLAGAFSGFVIENSDAAIEDFFGLADLTPTLPLGDSDADGVSEDPGADALEFYTRPDNPHAVGIDPGSGGGDAFDIGWAVDPATGEPAVLSGFDFIRVRTGPNVVAGPLGEVSTEIDAVATVARDRQWFDRNADARVDTEDLYAPASDVDGDALVTPRDERLLRACVRDGELEGVR